MDKPRFKISAIISVVVLILSFNGSGFAKIPVSKVYEALTDEQISELGILWVRKYVELYNNKDASGMVSMLSEDYVKDDGSQKADMLNRFLDDFEAAESIELRITSIDQVNIIEGHPPKVNVVFSWERTVTLRGRDIEWLSTGQDEMTIAVTAKTM